MHLKIGDLEFACKWEEREAAIANLNSVSLLNLISQQKEEEEDKKERKVWIEGGEVSYWICSVKENVKVRKEKQ